MFSGWEDCEPWVTGVEFTEQPFYFTTVRANPSLVSRPIMATVPAYPDAVRTTSKGVVFAVLVLPRERCHFNRAMHSIKLATVEGDLTALFEESGKIHQVHQHIESNLVSFTQGFCIQVFENLRKESDRPTEEVLMHFARENSLKLSFLNFDENTQSLWQTTVVNPLEENSQSLWQATVVDPLGKAVNVGQDRRLVRPIGMPSCHPAFIRSDNNSVFKCLRDVWNLLLKCPTDLPGVNDLKCTAQRELGDWLTAVLPDVAHDTCPPQPFIVIEGLDGAGKSTLVQKVAKVLNAKVMKTPPECLMDLRPIFDAYPSLIRRIYYSIGNYIVGKLIRETCKTHPVVMDRFWSSTAAYTIASECPGGDESVLPPHGHAVYNWPADLMQPTLVLLLMVSDEERESRLRHRTLTERLKETAEEGLLARNKLHQKRIIEAYRRMVNPSLVEVTADCTKEELLQKAMDCIDEDCNFLPPYQ